MSAKAAIKRASKAAREGMNRLDAQALKELIGIYQQAAGEIEVKIAAHGGPDGNVTLANLQNVLGQVNLTLQQLTQERNVLLQGKLDTAAAAGVAPFGGEAGLTSMAQQRIATEALTFVRGFVAADGLQLSDRLWRLDRGAREQLANRIEQAVIQGNSAAQAAREMLSAGSPVPADIQVKTKAAAAAPLGKAAGDILTRGEGSPLFNAMRVFRTEINRAHGSAYQRAAEQVPGSIGTRFLLSPAHPKPDICDLLAVQNLHGLGPGVYPHGKSPWPAHPNTLSYVEVVFDDEVTAADKAGQETPIEALKKLPADKRAGVLGLGKAQLLEAGKLTQGMIRTPLYKAQERLKGTAAANLTSEVLAAQKASAMAQGKAELARAIAEANKRAAQWKLDQIAGEKKGFAYQALQALLKSKLIPPDQGPADTLAQVESMAASLKAVKQKNDALSKYKAAAIADKTPPPAALKAFESLTDAEKADLQGKINTAKRAAAKQAAEAGQLRFEDLDRIGAQAGSNPGGFFKHRGTGEEWYVKQPSSADAARNEVLAAALYRAAGIDVPEVRLLDVAGKPGVASKIIAGVKSDPGALKAGRVANVFDGFAIDAWLANWDVAGLNFDNLLVKDGKAYRIDVGGSLRYRAQGGLKGSFGNLVGELQSLRNPSTNPQAAAVFAQMTPAQAQASAQRLRLLADDDIRRLVTEFGPLDAAENAKLANTLIARKQFVIQELGGNQKPIAAPADASARVTSQEHLAIKASRLNGYAMPTDKDQIEDQQVLFWNEADREGNIRTLAQMKLTAKGAEKLAPLVADAAGAAGFNDGGTFNKALDALKGIASTAGKSEPIRAKDIQRVKEARQAFNAQLGMLGAASPAGQGFAKHYGPWIDALEAAVAAGEGKAYAWKSPKGALKAYEPPPAPADAARFMTKKGVFETKEVRRGFARVTDEVNYTTGIFLEREFGDVTLRFWPDTAEVPFALRNQLQVISKGSDASAAERALKALDDIGIQAARATPADREELYLIQIAYHRREGWGDVRRKMAIKDQDKRIEALREIISTQAGTDITKSPLYRPDGSYQAFNQGRLGTFRPDLEGKAWTSFQQDYRLHHNITQQGGMAAALESILNSGGQMAPTVDRLRRGIRVGGTMSPEADLGTGGASYFFTRIKPAAEAIAQNGLVWKSRLVSRLDAISYDGDKFGNVKGDHVQNNRKTGVTEWKDASRRGSNETIFKNSLSIFDDLDRIVVEPREYDAVLAVLKSHGYTAWPDGRALTEVVKKRGSV